LALPLAFVIAPTTLALWRSTREEWQFAEE
jgi:hypothetical protein